MMDGAMMAPIAGAVSVMPLDQSAAPVPQYWVADAIIFTSNAARTAAVMIAEGNVNVIAPQIIGNQAAFLRVAIARAVSDLQALEANANLTNPPAVPVIRGALGHLFAAQAQANALSETAAVGGLGPTYQVTLQATLSHLRIADGMIRNITRIYTLP